jgi:hypothetical protein
MTFNRTVFIALSNKDSRVETNTDLFIHITETKRDVKLKINFITCLVYLIFKYFSLHFRTQLLEI